MKKALLIVITVLTASFAASAPAAETKLNVLLTGGPEQNLFSIRVTPDGTGYIISSVAPLEAPAGFCLHHEEKETLLICEATKIASFEVNAGNGDDYVVISPKVPVAVTLRGGPGNDHLYGGAGADKLTGGPGADSLTGRGGGDWLLGGAGNDTIYGGPGDDRLLGGPGLNEIYGGSGVNQTS